MAQSVYPLTPQPPIRALVVAAVASLIGALLLVLALNNGWHMIVVVLAALVLLVGVGLAVAAFATPARRRVTVTIDDDTFRVEGAGSLHEGQWAEVTRVTQSEDGNHVVIHEGPEKRTHLVFNRQRPELISDLLSDVRSRLQRFSA